MKKTAKTSIIFLLTLLVCNVLLPSVANAQTTKTDVVKSQNITNKESSIINKEALELYNSLRCRSTYQLPLTKNNNTIKTVSDGELNNGFKELAFISSDEENMEVVYSHVNSDLATIINYDKDTGLYNLVEANINTGEIVLLFNDEEYIVAQEAEDINVYNSQNDIQPILETTIIDGPDVSEANVVYTENSINSHTFGKEYGPYTKTNKSWVKDLSIIKVVVGGLRVFVDHPILQKIEYLASAGATVGSSIMTTYYIKFWQAYSNQNSTYVRERQRWYQNSNYTGFIKQRYSYFYSTRPY